MIPSEFTLQDMYAHIRAYFSRPDAVLAKNGSFCEYRTYEGNKCAVGCLFTDEQYWEWLSEFEGNGIQKLYDELSYSPESIQVILDKNQTNEKYEFLAAAQNQHDCFAHDAKDFVKRLDRLAIKSGLLPINSPYAIFA